VRHDSMWRTEALGTDLEIMTPRTADGTLTGSERKQR
jgi:hypothetical protein